MKASALFAPQFADTYADLYFERTLDDGAIRRIDIPEMLLLADAIPIGLLTSAHV